MRQSTAFVNDHSKNKTSNFILIFRQISHKMVPGRRLELPRDYSR